VSDDLPYAVAFSVFPGIGPVRYRLLCEFFGSARAAWNATPADLTGAGLGQGLTSAFDAFRKSFDRAAYQKELVRLHVAPLLYSDPRYPPLLKQISDAPFLLYVLGKKTDHPVDMQKTVAVVGTRRATAYGREMAGRIAGDLASAGVTVVSGMAFGVDAAAHRAAIEAGGKTVAVLGCGVDVIAPRTNETLYRAIADGAGAVVSEMPLGLRPVKGMFPARNRIISGLSLGTVIVEGTEISGALITARYAADQGREVFAVPGPVTNRYSQASSLLIRNGATLACSAADVLDGLGIPVPPAVPQSGNAFGMQTVTPQEGRILDVLADGREHIDSIVRKSGMPAATVAAAVTVLELRSRICRYGENIYGLPGKRR